MSQILYVPKIGMTKPDRSFYLNKYLKCWFPFNDMTKNVATDIMFGVQAFSETATNEYEDTDRGRFIQFGDRMSVTYQDDITRWFQSSIFSISSWIKTTDLTGGGIFRVLYSGETDKLVFDFDSNGRAGLILDYGVGQGSNIRGTTDIRDGEWHFIVGVRTGLRTAELWVDGKLEAEDTDNSGNLSGINTPYSEMRFGISNDGSTLSNGNLAHFRVHNYRLQSQDIQILYNNFWSGLSMPSETRYFYFPTTLPLSETLGTFKMRNLSFAPRGGGRTIIRKPS